MCGQTSRKRYRQKKTTKMVQMFLCFFVFWSVLHFSSKFPCFFCNFFKHVPKDPPQTQTLRTFSKKNPGRLAKDFQTIQIQHTLYHIRKARILHRIVPRDLTADAQNNVMPAGFWTYWFTDVRDGLDSNLRYERIVRSSRAFLCFSKGQIWFPYFLECSSHYLRVFRFLFDQIQSRA